MSDNRRRFQAAYQNRNYLKRIGEGFYNIIYLIEMSSDKFALKVPKIVKDFDLRTYQEDCILFELNKKGFDLSPRLVYASYRPRFMVIEFFDNNLVSQDFSSEEMFDALVGLHRLKFGVVPLPRRPFADRYRAFGIKQMRLYRRILDMYIPDLGAELLREALSCAQWNYRPEHVIHGDPTRSNFIRASRGDLKIIDFEFSAVGDPFFDYSFFLNRALAKNPDAIHILLNCLRFNNIDVKTSCILDILNISIFDTDRSICVAAAKFFNKQIASYDVARGESRICQLLRHRRELGQARQKVS